MNADEHGLAAVAFDLDTRFAEIEEQAQRSSGGFPIIQALGGKGVGAVLRCLEVPL
jgi:hypothetical protein